MAEPQESPAASEDNSAQHGIAAKPDLLWDFKDYSSMKIDGKPVKAGVVLRYRFLDGLDNQKKAVRTIIETAKKQAEGFSFVTWEDCASLRFYEVTSGKAEIQITFNRGYKKSDDGYWSVVGRDALDKEFSKKATMKLAGLPNVYPPKEHHRGSVLHEFGHAIGLRHEHQSPAMKVELRKEEVVKHYKNEEEAECQVLDRVKDATNYTRFDKDSIMVYTIPKAWQKIPAVVVKGTNPFEIIVSNNTLSTLDQAFIRLMYPPDLSDDSVDAQPFLDAMITAGVPNATAGNMLKVFAEKKGTVVDRLRSVRNYFNVWKQGSLFLYDPSKSVTNTINPEAVRLSGINGFVGEVTKNKLLRSIVKNIVYRAAVQNGIKPKVLLPGGSPYEVARMLGALAMHDDVGHYVEHLGGRLSGETPDETLPSTVSNDIVPALLEYMEMVESGDLAVTPPAERATREELDVAQEWLKQVLSRHPPDDVPAGVQSGILTKLPGVQKILDWFSRTVSETRIDVGNILPSATNKMLGALRKSPPQNIFQEVYSLCFASTFVHDVNGTQQGLQMKLQELLGALLPQISMGAPGGGWKLVWGPVVWKVKPEDNSGGPDLAWYIAYNDSVKCSDDDEPRPTYVISVAGTQARSVHTWLNSNFDVTTPIDFKNWMSILHSNPYMLSFPPAAQVDEGRPYLARGTARTVWQLLTVAAPSGAEAAGQSLFDFLKSKFQSNPSARLVTTGHSLGGALSPTLALVLVELGIISRDRVLTYFIAGPSPGNGAFTTLFSNTFPPKQVASVRQNYGVWNYNLVNEHDPVPQAWCADNRASPRQNLQNIRNMIPGSYVKGIVSAIITNVLGDLTAARVRYMPLRSQIFSARSSESFKDVRPQHTQAYHHFVGITPPELLDALKEG